MRLFNNETIENQKKLNDIVNLDRDVTFLSYMDVCDKLDKAIKEDDYDNKRIYMTMLHIKEKELIELFAYNLAQRYALTDSHIKSEDAMQRLSDSVDDLKEHVDKYCASEERYNKAMQMLAEYEFKEVNTDGRE